MSSPSPSEETIVPAATSPAWLEQDEWQGEDALRGTSAGFQKLRDAIDRLLAGPEDSIPLEGDLISIRVLKLDQSPPVTVEPAGSLAGKMAGYLFLVVLVLTLLLAAFGFCQLIQLFSP